MNIKLKRKLIKLYWILSTQFGLNVTRFLYSILYLPKFYADLLLFKKEYKGDLRLMPCLHDRNQEGGATKSEYFWQDLIVARKIYESKPDKHVDIGSRIDGFVSHVASFRDCEVLDVRPIRANIPGLIFRQTDIMDVNSLPMLSNGGYTDSLSCLHTIEHFGLGRYGDPINPEGYKKGLENIAKLILPNGILYLSTPVGKERVEFNAHRVFNPKTIINCAESFGLELKELLPIKSNETPYSLEINDETLIDLSLSEYQLVLFIFQKI